MLNRFYVNPILPAQDADRARRFYREVLGLDLLTGPTDDPMVFGAAEGSSVALSEMPDRTPPSRSWRWMGAGTSKPRSCPEW